METSSVFIVKKDEFPFDWETGAMAVQELGYEDFSLRTRELIEIDKEDKENLQKIRDFVSDMLLHFHEKINNSKSETYKSFKEFPLPTPYPAYIYTDTGNNKTKDICYSMLLQIMDCPKIMDSIGIKEIRCI
jgi:hypothetical protein